MKEIFAVLSNIYNIRKNKEYLFYYKKNIIVILLKNKYKCEREREMFAIIIHCDL